MSHRKGSDSDDIETYQTPCLCRLKATHRLTKMLDRTMCGCGSAQIPLPLLIQSWQTYYGRKMFKAENAGTFIRIQVRKTQNPLAPVNSMLRVVKLVHDRAFR